MEPYHDIYRKESLPFLKRRRRKQHSWNPEGGSDAPPPGQPPQGQAGHAEPGKEPPTLIDAWNTTSAPSVPRRRHHSRSREGRGGSKALWIVLACVLGLYAVVLIVSVYRTASRARADETARQSKISQRIAQSATGSIARAKTPAEVAQRVTEKIAVWNKMPDLILEAQSLKDRGLVDQATQRLEQALKVTPRAIPLQLELADVYAKQRRNSEAADILVDLLEANPGDLSARMMLAQVLESETNYPAALAVANWMLELDPNILEANQIAANAYLKTDRKSLAIPYLRRMVTLERDNVMAQNNLAVTYSDLGDYVKAIQLFNQVLKSDSANSLTYYNLAACYSKQSMDEQAVEILTRAGALFGQSFVNTWMQSKDFDSIRKSPLFMALQEKTSGKTPAGEEPPAATNAPPPADTSAPAGP